MSAIEDERDSAGGPPIRWEAPIPLATSRYFLGDCLWAVAVTVVLGYALVFLMGLIAGEGIVILPWQFAAGALVFVGVMFPLIALVVFQNHIDASFAVSSAGFEIASGAKVRKVNRIVLALALLGGRAASIGPAMLATADEERAIQWASVSSVKFHPRDRVIELRDSVLRMNRLFCPHDLYPHIEARVRSELAGATHQTRATDWRGTSIHVAWTALTGIAWFLAVAWGPDDALRWLIAAASAVALSEWVRWWLGRLLALIGLSCTVVASGMVAARALESTTYEGLFTIHGYDTDSTLLVVTVAGITLLLLIGVRRLLTRTAPER
ncbi:MAG: hypothetical protein EPO65_10570 [Dehalococcoidia bacterium]|nr:MAG: hypothetical protein EPO65_10570 [Dehalococcoidia bacterium]